MTDGLRRVAVLGHPVEHSLSPVLHQAAYRALGLSDWEYGRHDVDEAALAAFVDGLDATWAGLSLTMPLKHAVLPMLDHVEPLAEVVGAVNTVLVQGRAGQVGRPLLVGANTDVYGIVTALREAVAESGTVLPAHPSAVVLGAGATAASALAALGELGCSTPIVCLRSIGRSGALIRAAHRMGVEPEYVPLDGSSAHLLGADLVVSTLPAHAADGIAAALTAASAAGDADEHKGGTAGSRSPSRPGPAGALLDVVYDPHPTALSESWHRIGGAAVTGERMLLHQAAEQVRLMTGKIAPLAAMEAALAAALGPVPTY